MESQIAHMILMDMDSLSRKVVELLPNSQETILAAGLLAAASHILRTVETQVAGDPLLARSRPLGFPENGQSNPGNLDIAAIAQAVAARMTPVAIPASPRSLAHEMAGPLPSLHAGQRPPLRRPPPRKSKPVPIPIVSPRSHCPDCGDEVATHHPRDKTIGTDPEGRAVFVLCSQKRVRCEPIEE